MNIYLAYKKYNKDFIAYAKSISFNKHQAFDLVQEAYVSAIEREEIFDNMNEYQIRSWFFTTIKNENIDNIRKQRRLTYFENEGTFDIFNEIEDFEEEITIINTGKLIFDEKLDYEKFNEKVKFIVNYGVIEVPEDNIGIVKDKVRENYGKITVEKKVEDLDIEDIENEDILYSNIGELEL